MRVLEILGVFLVVFIFHIIGGVSHERDMMREFKATGQIVKSSWVYDFTCDNGEYQER